MPWGAASRTERGATMTGTEDEQAAKTPIAAAEAPRAIDGVARARIGCGLRLHDAEVLALPIPDRLRTLLDALAACPDTEVQP